MKKFREIKSDMFPGPFATSAPGGGIPDVIKAQLEHEEWYHGAVSRENAERLLKNVSHYQIIFSIFKAAVQHVSTRPSTSFLKYVQTFL